MVKSSNVAFALSIAVAIGAAACSADVATSGGGGGGQDGGAGGVGGQGGDGGDGGDVVEPLSCSPQPGDHSAVCAAGSSCPITADIAIDCEQAEFAELGLAVVVDDSRTHVAATSWSYTVLFDVDAETAQRVDSFPLDLNATRIALTVDEDGQLFGAGDETLGGSYEGGLTVVEEQASEFTREVVFDRDDKYIPLHDLEVDANGRVHVFYASEPPAERSHAVRDTDGTWASTVVATPNGSDWHRFALAEDGEPIAFGYRESNSAYQLVALGSNGELELGAPVTSVSFGPGRYRPAPRSLPTPATATYDYGALMATSAGLRYMRVTGSTVEEITIPDSAAPSYDCEVGPGAPPPCADPCTEQTSGLEYQAFDVARLGNGDTYVAVVISHVDQVITYGEQMIDAPTCVGNVQTDSSTSELRIYRIDANATVVTAPLITLPLGRYGASSSYTTTSSHHQGLALRAYGDTIGVALRLQDWSATELVPVTVRALRIDTTLLP